MKKYESKISLSSDDREAINDNLNQILEKFNDGLTSLSKARRKRLVKMGTKSRGFMEGAVKLGVTNPELLPRSMDPAIIAEKNETYSHLEAVAQQFAKLHEMVSDTMMLLGAELYEDARIIYDLAKNENLADGLQDNTRSLSKRYSGQGNKKKKREAESIKEDVNPIMI